MSTVIGVIQSSRTELVLKLKVKPRRQYTGAARLLPSQPPHLLQNARLLRRKVSRVTRRDPHYLSSGSDSRISAPAS